MSFIQIHRELSTAYGLQISERHVSNLFKLFLSLVEGRNLASNCVLERLREQGGIILSADVVVFDEASPPLFVARDVPSGEILCAERLDSGVGKRNELYARVLNRVKSCGVPVRGVVTDKEASLVAAVREVFPDTPHQFCQTHYLQNLRNLMEAELSELGKAVREVANLNQKAEREFHGSSTDAKEKRIALEICRVIKTQSKVSGDKLINPTAFKRYGRLNYALKTVKAALKKPGQWPLLERLRVVLEPIEAHQKLGELLEKEMGVVWQVAHILKEGGASGSQVAADLQNYLDTLDVGALSDLRWARFVNGGERLTQRYWPGLFHCYDVPGLPSTNNDLESFFGALKRQRRKVTGKVSTSGGPIETCAAYVLGAWSSVHKYPDLVSLLQGLSDQEISQARARLEELAEPARLKRGLSRDSERFLNKLLTDWDENEFQT